MSCSAAHRERVRAYGSARAALSTPSAPQAFACDGSARNAAQAGMRHGVEQVSAHVAHPCGGLVWDCLHIHRPAHERAQPAHPARRRGAPRSLLVFLKRPYGQSPAMAYLQTSGELKVSSRLERSIRGTLRSLPMSSSSRARVASTMLPHCGVYASACARALHGT